MRLSRFFHRAKADRDQQEQIESYIRIETDENIERGMPEADARAAALRKFGNRRLIREEVYSMNTLGFLETLSRDLRYSFRGLRRSPVFTLTVLLTLAIGIGANTAVFSVVNSVLLKPLPYPDSGRLVYMAHDAPGAAGIASVSGDLLLSESMFETYADRNRSFEAMGLWASGLMAVTGVGQPDQVRATYLIGDGMRALDVPPVFGRWISADDNRPDRPSVIVLSYGYWQRRFGGSRAIIGHTLTLDSRPRVIAGVMPRGFRFAGEDSDLFVPLVVDRAKLLLPGFGFKCVGRLKGGIALAQARSDIARLLPVWMDSWPAAPGINPHVYDSWRISATVRPLQDEVVGKVRGVLWIVMATIGIVMLIVAANVANLLLVRGQARQQEIAVRAALGAARSRIVRELLVESVLLAVLGGTLGVALAIVGLKLLRAIGPGNLPRLDEISIDPRALAFAFAVSILSGLVFGSITALKYAGARIALNLRAGGRSLSESRDRHRTRSVLVIAQVAMALVLLVSAGLMIRTFKALHGVEPGFTNPEQIQTFRTSIPPSLVSEPERVVRMQREMVEKLRAIHGVSSVAYASEMPMDGIPTNWDDIRTEGQDTGKTIPPLRVFRYVSPGLFSTMGTRMVAGRDYTWTDILDDRPYIVLSENLARELWGSAAAAVGKRIAASLPSSPWREVIGVVEDIHDNGVQKPASAIVYWPAYQNGIYDPKPHQEVTRTVSFALRSSRAGSESLRTEVEQAVWSVSPSLPIATSRTMRDIYDQSLAQTSFTLVMLAIAAAMALLLGVIGIYGVIAYAVAQKRREIGIRLALGAQQGELRRMFVGQGLVLTGIGAVIGICAAMLLTRLMRSLLFGISSLDPVTYIGVPLILAVAAMAASYLPARRAASVDPVETLRAE